MDPLRTAFVDSIPTNKDDVVSSALRPLGLVKWVPVQSGCGFAQFSSAAQVKAALEVLPMAGLRVTVSKETETWVSRAAAKATVQNVTRMSPVYLTNKIKTVLGKSQGKNSNDARDESLRTIAPDGTFEIKDPALWDEIRRFREQSRAAKERDAAASARRPPPPKRARRADSGATTKSDASPASEYDSAASPRRAESSSAVEGPLVPPVEGQVASEKHGDNDVSSAQDSSAQSSASGMPAASRHDASPSSAPLHKNASPQPQASPSSPLDPLRSQQGPVEHVPSPLVSTGATASESREVDTTVEQQSSSLLTPSSAARVEEILPSLVEEFFGVPDEDVISTLKTHISEKRPESRLAAEFEDVLEADFARFAEKVQKLGE